MADWGGFTEDDLRLLAYPGKIDMEHLHSIQDPPRKPSGGTPKKQASFGKQRGKNAHRGRSFNQQKKRVTLSDVVEVMPVDQMLNPDSLSNGDAGSPSPVTNDETKGSPTKPPNPKTPPKSVLKPSKPIERQLSHTNSDSVGNEGKISDEHSLNEVECSRELDEEEALNRELNQIQKFQHQQKLIEEKNKQTKTLLAQAIKERRARAESEAHLLTDLQKELSRLDTLLTTDVSIIRDRIETASLEYSESQKRYEKAEKEFVNAKMELFRRAETKEKLTEHLYTIIYQNEMRKAQKLSELMEMLELTTACEEVECILPAIPTPMYNPMQTLGSCGKFPHTTKPGSADSTVKPGNADSTVKPGNADQAVKPGNADQAVKPGNADQAVKPGNADQAVKPGNADQAVKPGNADQAVKPGNADPTVKPDSADSTVKISIEQKVEGQSVAPNVPIERKESLSECSPSSSPMSQIHKEGQVKQNEPNMIADVCIASSSLQNSSATPMTAEVESAVDPSVELPESESSKEDEEHGASLSGRCNISDSDSLTETEKISSQSQLNDDTKRTNKEKKTTLKELAK